MKFEEKLNVLLISLEFLWIPLKDKIVILFYRNGITLICELYHNQCCCCSVFLFAEKDYHIHIFSVFHSLDCFCITYHYCFPRISSSESPYLHLALCFTDYCKCHLHHHLSVPSQTTVAQIWGPGESVCGCKCFKRPFHPQSYECSINVSPNTLAVNSFRQFSLHV